MTQTRYADISSLLPQIYEGAFMTLRQENLLVPTVTVFNNTSSMVTRNNSSYGTANPRSVAEGEDVTPTQLTRTALSTLTPARWSDQFFLTDERINSDDQSIQMDAAMELGGSFAQAVDVAVAANFSSLTGGTVGAAAGTLLWTDIVKARAIMHNLSVPGPYFCALHPFQWMYLVQSSVVNGTEISAAPNFNDEFTQSYFKSTLFGDVIFVITPSIVPDGSDDAIGAMYPRMALAYDERTPFTIEPERDASRQGWELNANLRYATGTWRPAVGVQLIGDAATPSG